jgi:hypothetical protein
MMLPSGAIVTPVPPSLMGPPELDDAVPPDDPDETLLPLLDMPPPPLPPELAPLADAPPLPFPPEPELPPLPDELELPPGTGAPCGPLEEQPRTTVRDAKAAVVVNFMAKRTPLMWWARSQAACNARKP